ncbi:KRAB-A domain-containing protein 2-like [Penaeus japonicus]|uniref:KRAB-A domain-containing protein 2-like n=1 Tax=Penaeus japonicus TaxID=27405 RepID=UPI001C70FB93|nr:KRAB-A domain-containing protein 2-like [Penaeus japonicus]
MDLVELPKSDNDFKYVLVIVDQLSRFTQLVPLKDKQAVTVTNALINDFITIFGPPQAFICDNGTEFSNSLLRAVCKLLETKINFTTPYHPESNGLCERTNRVVKDTLYALTEKNPRRWDTMIPHVRFAINSSVNRSVNNQPLYLMLGQSIHYPVGLTNKLTVNKPANERFAKLIQARDAAVLASKQCREYNKDYVARKSIPATDLDVGSLILRKSPPQKATGLTARWTGPLRITKRTGPVTYLVKDLVKNSVYRLHRNDMLPYEAQDELEILSAWSVPAAVLMGCSDQ